MPIQASGGKSGRNQPTDVQTVQQLLNQQKNPAYTFGAVTVDGKSGPQTIAAIKSFQRQVVKLSSPDGRVDPGGKTITALEQASGIPGGAPLSDSNPMPRPAASSVWFIKFIHDDVRPTSTGHTMYESDIVVTGPDVIESFHGSIYPNNMAVKGRIKDGLYELHIGFHKRGVVPTIDDLVMKNSDAGNRPAIIVSRDGSVPVLSDNPNKITSSAIHIHNGFNSARGSDGCLTVKPADWPRFISLFLDRYRNLEDWYPGGDTPYLGLKIGTLQVRK